MKTGFYFDRTTAGTIALKCEACRHVKTIPADADHAEVGAIFRDFAKQHAACAGQPAEKTK